MKSKKYLLSILSVFIIIVSYIIYVSNNDTVFANINKSMLIKSEVDFIRDKCNNGEKMFCEFNKIVDSAIKGEIDNVIYYMEKLENRGNNKDSYPVDCHVLAHTIGKILFYHLGLKNSVLTKNICTAGIYHGAFEEWGTISNLNEVKKVIINICDNKDKQSISYKLCIHGTGRALYRSINDVIVGSDGCSEAFKNREDELSCFEGVLSSHILIEFGKKNYLSFKVENDYLNKLIKDCELIDSKYTRGCIGITLIEYSKQKLFSKNSDLLTMTEKEIFEEKEKFLLKLSDYAILCQDLDNFSSQHACAQSVGFALLELLGAFESEYLKSNLNRNNEDYDKYSQIDASRYPSHFFSVVKKEDILKSINVCTKFNEEHIGACIGGAVTFVLGRLSDAKLAEELCKISNKDVISNKDDICVNLKDQIMIYTKLN